MFPWYAMVLGQIFMDKDLPIIRSRGCAWMKLLGA